MGDAFHQAAIAEENVGVVVNNGVLIGVELGSQRALGNRHAHTVGDALTQRAGGGFHARRIAVFRVTRGFGVQLTELFQIIDAEVVTGEVQQRINQHGAVAVGQDETVTIRPLGVGRIVFHVIVPQHFGDIGHAHGRARVT